MVARLMATERGWAAAEFLLRQKAREVAAREKDTAEALARPILDVVTWAERYFFVPELNAPVQLAPYQKQALTEIFRPGDDGLFRYSTVVWSDIKKSIKSTLAAAVCLWWADTHPWSSIRIVANDLKQADSREGEYIRRAVELNRSYFIGKRGARVRPSGCTVDLCNHSHIEAVPLDPRGEAGGGDDIVVFSELWAAKSDAHRRMWTEMTLSPIKFGKSFRWVETYAGYTGESPILQQLYRLGVEQGTRLDDDLEMFGNVPSRLFCLWNTLPRLPWQTKEYYAQEAAALTPTEFDRVHRNKWVTATSHAIPQEWWDACKNGHPLSSGDIAKGTPLVLGVDASVSGDATGLVVVSKHPDIADHISIRLAKAWYPQDQVGGTINYHETITPAIQKMVDAGFNIAEIAYDPYQLHQWACDCRDKDRWPWLRPFSQGDDRLKADKSLYDLIRERRLHHPGDLDLTRHIQNCDKKLEPSQDNKLRFVKKTDGLPIDLAVAASMATFECLRLTL